jgi:uncharacterized protein YbcV (DUF1398 family)
MTTAERTIELINNLVDARYADPGSFSEFTETLKKLGLTFFHYDVMADELRFYAGDVMAHTIKRDDIKEARSHLSRSTSFDISALERAIELFDSGKSSAVKFHEEVFAAGVILCSVFLSHQRIIYLGVDGKTYREDY